MGLNLYAKIEPMLPFEHEVVALYTQFIEKIEEHKNIKDSKEYYKK